ncbi:hypothetical protein ACTQ5F_02420 [Jeotgalibaca porci]|uniref:hypothetical protein n=1 Tax=Jeotgalibaca porci TaxID=1868793 RepID=UPI003F90038C
MQNKTAMTISEVNETLDKLVAEVGYSELLDSIVSVLDIETRTAVLNKLITAYNIEE